MKDDENRCGSDWKLGDLSATEPKSSKRPGRVSQGAAKANWWRRQRSQGRCQIGSHGLRRQRPQGTAQLGAQELLPPRQGLQLQERGLL